MRHLRVQRIEESNLTTDKCEDEQKDPELNKQWMSDLTGTRRVQLAAKRSLGTSYV